MTLKMDYPIDKASVRHVHLPIHVGPAGKPILNVAVELVIEGLAFTEYCSGQSFGTKVEPLFIREVQTPCNAPVPSCKKTGHEIFMGITE